MTEQAGLTITTNDAAETRVIDETAPESTQKTTATKKTTAVTVEGGE